MLISSPCHQTPRPPYPLENSLVDPFEHRVFSVLLEKQPMVIAQPVLEHVHETVQGVEDQPRTHSKYIRHSLPILQANLSGIRIAADGEGQIAADAGIGCSTNKIIKRGEPWPQSREYSKLIRLFSFRCRVPASLVL